MSILIQKGLRSVLLGALLALAGPLAAADGFHAQLEPFLAQTVSAERLPGLAVGVVQDGRLVYSRGFGVTSLEGDGAPVTPRTLFHLASLTKAFVATSALQLVESGRVELDAPVQRYVPYFESADARAS